MVVIACERICLFIISEREHLFISASSVTRGQAEAALLSTTKKRHQSRLSGDRVSNMLARHEGQCAPFFQQTMWLRDIFFLQLRHLVLSFLSPPAPCDFIFSPATPEAVQRFFVKSVALSILLYLISDILHQISSNLLASIIIRQSITASYHALTLILLYSDRKIPLSCPYLAIRLVYKWRTRTNLWIRQP